MSKNKIERNGPCPCGSGRKYKRCCLRLGRSDPYAGTVDPGLFPRHMMFTPAAALAVARGERFPGFELDPWVVAQLRDRLNIGPGGRPPGHTISSVRRLDDDAVAAAAGVTDREAFVGLTSEYLSAWHLAEEELGAGDDELVGLAACELWRRLSPERPSLEMLDEQMQHGYLALDLGEARTACSLWLDLAERLLEVLPDDIDAVDEVSALFPGLNSLSNWLEELGTPLYNVARHDASVASRAVSIYAELVERFPASSRLGHLQSELELLRTLC